MAQPRLTVLEASAAAVAALAILIATAPFLVELGYHAMALSQLLAFALPPVTLAALKGGSIARRLGLVRPSGTAMGAALLLGIGLWLLNWQGIGPLVEQIAGDDQVRAVEERLTPYRDLPLPLLLLYLAVLPAICEELLHRGAIARALGPPVGIAAATGISATVFAISHASWVLMIPMFLLGSGLAYATLASGSLWPSMAIHFINNSVALLASRCDQADLSAVAEQRPLLLAGGIAASIAGIALLHRCRSGSTENGK